MSDFMEFIKDNVVITVVVVATMFGFLIYIIRRLKGNFFQLDREKKPLIENDLLERNDDDNDDDVAEFIPALAFDGPKPGYVFKTSDKGTGYYKDTDS